MARRLSPEEGVLFDAIKRKRHEIVLLVEQIDVAGDAYAERQRRDAIGTLDEGCGLALRALSRPPRSSKRGL